MRVLFDHSTPAPLRHELKDHVVVEAIERGWESLGNGVLLDTAEAAGFEIFVTADKNMRHQQNLAGRKIAIIVLGNAQWPVLRRHVDQVVRALSEAKPGSYSEVVIPGR
jgi:predicted nuclease of predicted toxin-antitoxin system